VQDIPSVLKRKKSDKPATPRLLGCMGGGEDEEGEKGGPVNLVRLTSSLGRAGSASNPVLERD